MASRIQRQYPLDPKMRKRQKIVGPALKSVARVGVIQGTAKTLSMIAEELEEYRTLASQRPTDPVGIKEFNEEIQPVVRAMERQIGWSAQYRDAVNVCSKTMTKYERQLKKKYRPYLAQRLRNVESLCRVTLENSHDRLVKARNSFAPCFCPSQRLTTDQQFEVAAMLERFARGRPGTFADERELIARGTPVKRGPGRRSLAEIRRLQEESASTWGSARWSLPQTPVKRTRTGKPRKGRRK